MAEEISFFAKAFKLTTVVAIQDIPNEHNNSVIAETGKPVAGISDMDIANTVNHSSNKTQN